MHHLSAMMRRSMKRIGPAVGRALALATWHGPKAAAPHIMSAKIATCTTTSRSPNAPLRHGELQSLTRPSRIAVAARTPFGGKRILAEEDWHGAQR
jgi:hypothetical protein